MKYSKFVVFLPIIFTILFSCSKKNDVPIITKSNDCVFKQINENTNGIIDNNERMIMKEYLDNSLKSKTEIENNLICEWKLIGHVEQWILSISLPCGYIAILGIS